MKDMNFAEAILVLIEDPDKIMIQGNERNSHYRQLRVSPNGYFYFETIDDGVVQDCRKGAFGFNGNITLTGRWHEKGAENPVTFQEAMESGKRIKYCHEHNESSYMELDDMLEDLSEYFSKTARRIMTEGEWFIEGDK